MIRKSCNVCNTEFLSKYHRQKRCSKECILIDKERKNKNYKEYMKIYNIKNKEKIKEVNKIYSIKNKEKLKKYYKDNYEKNKVKINEKNKQKYIKKIKIYKIQYRKLFLYLEKNWIKNKKEMRSRNEYYNEWYQNNKNYIKEYNKKKYHNNIQYKLMVDYRNRMNLALKQNKKRNHTIEYLGCSLEEFEKYLESKFLPDMNWKNYNLKGWHKDHIIPCDSFDLQNEEELKKCFHYSNFQPLWAKENISKSNKILSI